MAKGLTSEEVKGRLARDGFNELPSPKSKNLLSILKEIVKEPMFILLIGCGTLYMVLGDIREGVVMLCMISLIISITYFQHRKTEKALEALRVLSSPRALVFRDGEWIRIPGREVVVGDIVKLEEGDRIPADGKLIESINLQADESIITGESFPVSHNINSDVLSGTLVTKGTAQLEVCKTGIKTEFGKIGMSLHSIEDKQTALQSEMKKLIRKLAIAGILICVIVVTVFYLTRGNFLHALLNGLASAMAILPEEFPVVLTVFLALGAWRLSKKSVLTRKPSAIETLGSATVLCSDKTGTITINKMIVKQLSILQENNLVKSVPDIKSPQEILISAWYASYPEGSDPMERAISEVCSIPLEHKEITHDFPLTHEFLAMTRIYRSDQDEYMAYSKGAPEAIIELCKLSEETKELLKQEIIRMASDGLRVIAVSSKKISEKIPDDQKDLNSEFLGLIGFEDPIRKEVPSAVQECHSAGIRIIMITGDYPETAKNIGKQIGLNTSEILHGDELKELSPEQLTEKLKTISILARIKPEQKLQIVKCLQSSGEIVAMTGDGVNDAPALKAADIGIAMGMKGTDVAREASSLVILDDNFASIVGAVSLGRRIFDNLQKAMSYILAIHIPIIGLALLPAFFVDFPILMLPLHIIFMELIIDPVSSIAFETEKDEKDIMLKPPRSKNKAFFGRKEIVWSIFDGAMLLSSVLIVFLISKEEGHSVEQLRAICFITLMLGNVFLILSKLSYTRYFYRTLFGPNHAAKIILLISCSILVIMLSVPGINDLFQMQFPGIRHLIVSFAGATALLCVLELKKYIRNTRSVQSGRQ